MGIGKGRVLCEGAVCVRQAVGRMSWETLGNVFGKLGGGRQEIKSFQGQEEVREIMSIGVGTQNYT